MPNTFLWQQYANVRLCEKEDITPTVDSWVVFLHRVRKRLELFDLMCPIKDQDEGESVWFLRLFRVKASRHKCMPTATDAGWLDHFEWIAKRRLAEAMLFIQQTEFKDFLRGFRPTHAVHSHACDEVNTVAHEKCARVHVLAHF